MAKGCVQLLCLLIASNLIVIALAETHVVGDSLGWMVPPLGDIAYRTWASRQNFEIGDTIIFKWNNTHTVARVSREDYDNCTAGSATGQIQTTSPANFTIDSNGPHYFICTIRNHCSLGQKVTITVGSSAASSLTTTTTLSVTLMTIAITFLSFVQ